MDSTAHDHPDAMPEGEEAAPTGARFMGLLRWLLVAAMAALAAVSVHGYVRSHTAGAVNPDAKLFHCPMHPAVIQDHPGDCPICGMSLVAVAAAAPAAGHEGHRHEPSDPYACPMDPEETSPDPKARCPVCKMFLVPREQIPALAKQDSERVPGLVPVEISQDRIQLAGVRTAPVAKESLGSELRTAGALAAAEDGLSHVHTRVSGWIEQVFVGETGARVAAGQELATLYSPELLAAQQELVNARRWAAQGGANANLEADARRKLELLGLSPAELAELERTGQPQRAVKIRATAAGHVVARAAFPGLYVQPGTELFQVADLSRVWLLADVYESEIGRVKVGQLATLALPAYPGETFTGRVQFLSPTLNSDTRTLRIRIAFKNADLKLKPGMYGDVSLQLARAEGLVVPAEAIVDTGEAQYVFLARDGGRFEPRRVKLGLRQGEKVQILDGLAAGDSVVTTANFLIDSESRLRAAIEGLGAPQAGHDAHARTEQR